MYGVSETFGRSLLWR